jgi:hypothetical protein
LYSQRLVDFAVYSGHRWSGTLVAVTQKGAPFKGHDVSLNSLSDLIAKLATTPGLHARQRIGVSRAEQ